MTKEALTWLQQEGIDVDDAMERFMGNTELLERFLKKFLEDANYKKLEDAIKNKDEKEAYAASHTLKSLTGNLSLTKLHQFFSKQAELIQGGQWEQGVELMDEIGKEYQRVLELIKLL